MNFDDIKTDDILYHEEHGYLYVKEVASENKIKAILTCYVYENGAKNSEKEVFVVRDEASRLVSRILVTAKIYMSSNEILT